MLCWAEGKQATDFPVHGYYVTVLEE